MERYGTWVSDGYGRTRDISNNNGPTSTSNIVNRGGGWSGPALRFALPKEMGIGMGMG